MKTLATLEAPIVPVRKLLEKDVQRMCVDWARARGYWARKFSSQSQRSVPDYLFARREMPRMLPGIIAQVIFACEFKTPGNTPTPAQQDEIDAMRRAGWPAFWADSLENFQAIVLALERSRAFPV